jgi:hypothetical protein
MSFFVRSSNRFLLRTTCRSHLLSLSTLRLPPSINLTSRRIITQRSCVQPPPRPRRVVQMQPPRLLLSLTPQAHESIPFFVNCGEFHARIDSISRNHLVLLRLVTQCPTRRVHNRLAAPHLYLYM